MQYNKIYNKIVEYRKSNPSNNSYTEKHHIVPKCLGGDNSKNNLVAVSTREHYLLHHLLIKIYPENASISRAFKMLRNRLHIDRTSSPYSCIRRGEYSEINITWYGKHLSEEHKQKLSESLKGKKHKKHKPLSEETKRRITESRKGKIFVNNGLITKLVFPNEIPEGFVKGKLIKI